MTRHTTTRRTYLSVLGTTALTAATGCLSAGEEFMSDPPVDLPGSREDSGRSDPRLIAHRGCAKEYPENTLHAFEQVSPHVDGIEFDVQRCGSGEIVVFHDETLDRVTDCTGRVDETDYDDLAACSVLDSDEGVPLLADAFQTIPSDIEVNVELKEPGMAGQVLGEIETVDHDVLVSSFSTSALEQFGRLTDSIPLAFLFDDDPVDGLETARLLDCTAVHPRHQLCTTSDLVDRAHEAGLDVNAWTVTDRETASELQAVDVDGLITDRLDVI
ncbi:MAG: glycerophosphodiester phosphodiesterase [Halorhabdus sp.]